MKKISIQQIVNILTSHHRSDGDEGNLNVNVFSFAADDIVTVAHSVAVNGGLPVEKDRRDLVQMIVGILKLFKVNNAAMTIHSVDYHSAAVLIQTAIYEDGKEVDAQVVPVGRVAYSSKYERHGKAIRMVEVKEDGTMWATNGEYSSRVNFCPFTGKAAPKQMEVESEGVQDFGDKLPFIYYK